MPEKQPRHLFILLFGVLLPLVTIGVEYSQRLCATAIFDPLPTLWHVIWVSCVPLGNLLGWRACRHGWGQHPLPLGVLLGIALGIAGIYSLYFLPLLPLALMAIPFFGLGLLPLSPLLSFATTQYVWRRIRPLLAPEGQKRIPGLRLGLSLSLLAFFRLDGHEVGTHLAMSAASSPALATQQQGVRWLRTLGSEDLLLRECSDRSRLRRGYDLFLSGPRLELTAEQACALYFRVTGVPAETTLTATSGHEMHTSQSVALDFDSYQGGTVVGQQLRDLAVIHSQMEGTIDANGAVAYIEWTLVLHNTSAQEREARAKILLPPGGVVSRATLWIDGQEREAAFGSRAQVRQAYAQIVQRRRDPLLVTTAGKDRILVQCFPILPNGGEMKIRLGITAPLQLENREKATFLLPSFIEQNFAMDKGLLHQLQVESQTPIQTQNNLHVEWQEHAARYVLRDSASQEEMALRFAVQADRSVAITQAWTQDSLHSTGALIKQTIVEQIPERPKHIVLVIDRSRTMRPVLAHIADALVRLPEDLELTVLTGGEQYEVLASGVRSGEPESLKKITTRLLALESEGGYDNVPALHHAWRLATEKPGSAVVWVHGPQPKPGLQASLSLCRVPCTKTPLFDLAVTRGPNWVQEQLIEQIDLRSVDHQGEVSQALGRLFASWQEQTSVLRLRRERVVDEEAAVTTREGVETLPALVQLWAREEGERLIASGDSAQKTQALQLVTIYRVVTPISGAVVLETAQQYKEAGLQTPAVPVPEPGSLPLLGAGLLLLLWQSVWRKRQ